MPIYIHGKRTQENTCYFDKELLSKYNDNDKKMENNKVGKENKENISEKELYTV